jgi:hypothetical protein
MMIQNFTAIQYDKMGKRVQLRSSLCPSMTMLFAFNLIFQLSSFIRLFDK